MRRCSLVATFAAVLCLTGAALAQTTSAGAGESASDPAAEQAAAEDEDALKANARSLANDASSAYRSGNFASAYDGFNRAFQLVKVPMLGIWSARSLFELGRFVEASERYRDVVKLKLPPDAPEADLQALSTARAELDQLLPKIPTLTVSLRNAKLEEVQLTLDGKPLPAALVGVAQKVDPGEHVVLGTVGSETVERAVFLKEGDAPGIELVFKPTASFERASSGEEAKSGRTTKTLGWISVGVGGALLVGGAVTLAVSLDQQGQLSAACPSGTCPPDESDLVSSFELMKTLTLVGFIGGGALEALGVTLLITAPRTGREVSLRSRGAGLVLGGTF